MPRGNLRRAREMIARFAYTMSLVLQSLLPRCVVDCNVGNISTVTPLLKEDIYFDSALCVEAF